VQRTSTWIFTTTLRGERRLFEDKFDAIPFLSRAVKIELDWRGSELDFAIRARDIAQKEGLDGRGIDEYLKLATEHKCNLRSMLNAIDAGELLEA
jgi:hypothetical protein